VNATNIGADWDTPRKRADANDDHEELLPPLGPADGTTSRPQPGQHHNGHLIGWRWNSPDRPAAWRAFEEDAK
jgi:hypothetical protein